MINGIQYTQYTSYEKLKNFVNLIERIEMYSIKYRTANTACVNLLNTVVRHRPLCYALPLSSATVVSHVSLFFLLKNILKMYFR